MKYCKAYYLRDLRRFASWAELAKGKEKQLEDDDVVYVRDDLTVTTTGHDTEEDDDLVYDEVSAAWEAFCQDELKFEIPDWEAESIRMREERERGLSIVLGFAYLETGNGVVDLIDVPGHEAFIRAMIAGATR